MSTSKCTFENVYTLLEVEVASILIEMACGSENASPLGMLLLDCLFFVSNAVHQINIYHCTNQSARKRPVTLNPKILEQALFKWLT